MKALNRLIKAVCYVATLLWVFLGLYLFALLVTASASGLFVSAFSIITKSIPDVLQNYIGLMTVITAVPITLILYLSSYIKARKQSKKILESMQKKEE